MCLRTLGPRGALQWTSYRFRKRFQIFPLRNVGVRPRGLDHSIEMRGGESSDPDVFRQIFIEEEYKVLLSMRPVFIMDLGANIGLSSLWLLTQFPQATILAVEPDPGNYLLCCKNLERYEQRARVVRGAAWSKSTLLAVVRGAYRDGREWTTQVTEAKSTESGLQVEGWDIGSLLDLSKARAVDILKVDIEGSELEVFASGSESWLPYVHNICIELHGETCERVFFSALKDYDYDLSYSGELTICTRLRLRNSQLSKLADNSA